MPPDPHNLPSTTLPLVAMARDAWRRVRFGDVARCMNESDSTPLDHGLERYVGLDHMDPEDLRVKRWGAITDGSSFTRVFRSEQVLFGKRRAYQRKVALADFDGICSSDILVFEAKPDVLLPGLLPFLVQSEGFFQRALGTSAGSLSPRTRWTDLANYEFLLPPMEEQRRIAEILWAAESATRCNHECSASIASLRATLVDEIWKSKSLHSSLGDLLVDVQYGTSEPSGERMDDGIPILRIPNVLSGGLSLSDLAWVRLAGAETSRYRVSNGDILIVRTNGNPQYVGRSCVIESLPNDMVFASYLIRLRFDHTRVHPSFANALINSSRFRNGLRGDVRSSAGNYNLNTQGIKRQRIPLLSLQEQDEMCRRLCEISNAHSNGVHHSARCHRLKFMLMEHLLFVDEGNVTPCSMNPTR